VQKNEGSGIFCEPKGQGGWSDGKTTQLQKVAWGLGSIVNNVKGKKRGSETVTMTRKKESVPRRKRNTTTPLGTITSPCT